MREVEERAFKLLASDKPIEAFTEQDRNTLFKYLKEDCECNPEGAMKDVFQISILFFKPERLNLKNIDNNIKLDAILHYIAGGGDKDFTLEKYMEELAHYQRLKESTQKSLSTAESDLKSFSARAEEVKDPNSLIRARRQTLLVGANPDATNSMHVINDVIFDFDVYDVPKPPKIQNERGQWVDDPNPPKIFKWSIFDKLTGEKICGEERGLDPDANFGLEKKRRIDEYMSGRMDLIQKRKNEIIRSVKGMDQRHTAVLGQEHNAEGYLRGYEESKKTHDDVYSATKNAEIKQIRKSLQAERGLGVKSL